MPGQDVYPWEMWQQHYDRDWLQPPKSKKNKQHMNRRKLKYAAGAVGGILVVDFVKRQIGKVPIIGPVLSPIVGVFVPTLIAGSLLGVAAVYGYERGDPLAARELVPVAEKKLAEASSVVKDNLGKALQHITAPMDEMLHELDQIQERETRRLPPPAQVRGEGPEGSYEDLVGALERITKDLLGSPEFESSQRR